MSKAKALLQESAAGTNPFDEYEAVVPAGVVLSYDDGHGCTMPFATAEEAGLEACANVVFVLVAGGLGERLGYSGIKLSLETNLCTHLSYLEVYVRYIQAVQYVAQQRTGDVTLRIPLVIMTSGDTDHLTRQLLQEKSNFGLDVDQIQIVMQDKVAALKDGHAGLALEKEDRWTVQTKPHGHGDVHHLLYREGLVDRWEQQGKTHVVFLQDTNILIINSVIATLGVSVTQGFHMNSICIQRLAGEAAGAIARLEYVFVAAYNAVASEPVVAFAAIGLSPCLCLWSVSFVSLLLYCFLCRMFSSRRTFGRGACASCFLPVRCRHKNDPNKSLVINVEYNQLDPLLRTQGDCQGDVANPQTGYSPFPGNSNILVLEMSAYATTLRGEDQGVVLEFVNPKYKDDTRTEFKKPTRLECMMQDIPKLFQKEMGAEANIGFTMFERWFTFSPAKNSLEAGQDAVKAGNTAPGTMSSAESDKYVQNQRKLKHLGVDVHVTEDEDYVMMAGIPVTQGPRIILCPSFGISKQETVDKIKGPVSLTQRSALVLDGHHLTLNGLEVDGALVIRAGDDSHVTVEGLKVRNEGWELQELDPDQDYPETVRIRGYTMNKKETREYIVNEPGHFIIDASGAVKKVD